METVLAYMREQPEGFVPDITVMCYELNMMPELFEEAMEALEAYQIIDVWIDTRKGLIQ